MADEPTIVYDDDNENFKEEGNEEGEELIVKFKKLKERLKRIHQEKEDYLVGWQRCQADLINYKRRQEEQLKEWQKLINEFLIIELLPVLDSLEKALAIHEGQDTGLEKIQKQLREILKKQGLEEIKAIGEKFNPEFHEAVEQVESDEKEGIVAEEVQKGYILNGKVIRTAKVKVNK